MTSHPFITIAPNGARLQKSDHAAVPLSTKELAATARACQVAGANAIHLHVRDANGGHSLDTNLYRAAISAINDVAPGLQIQVTTEAAGQYTVAAQLAMLKDLKPAAASIAVREIGRSPELVADVYATAQKQNTKVQHILYGANCIDVLLGWIATGRVPQDMRDVILVLGQYAPARFGRPEELTHMVERLQKSQLRVTVCAFGPDEQACLLAAARLGCELRVGFENNLIAPDGTPWSDNAAAVRSLKAACMADTAECAT